MDDPVPPARLERLHALRDQARASRDRGRFDEAEATLWQALAAWEQVADAFPGPGVQVEIARTHLDLGVLYRDMGRVDGAEEALRRAIGLLKPLTRTLPDDPDCQARLAVCHNQLGILYQETGRFHRAEAAYQKARTHRERLAQGHPDDRDNWINLGGTLSNLGHLALERGIPRAAFAWFKRAVRVLKDALDNQGRHFRAEKLLISARAGRARAGTAKPPAEPPGVPLAALGCRLPGPPPLFPAVDLPFPAEATGGAEAMEALRYPLALAALGRFLESHPDRADGWFWKARVLGRLGRYAEALEALERVLALEPERAEAWYDKTDLLRFLGREPEAQSGIDYLLGHSRQDAATWYLKGLILGRFLDDKPGPLEAFDPDQGDQAIDAFDKALLLAADDYPARFYKGLTLLQMAQTYQAAYHTLAELAGTQGHAETARVSLRPYQLAFRCCFQRARESFDHAIRLRPDDSRAWYYKGRLLVDLEVGHEASAAAVFTSAVALQPDLADAWFELARLADRRGDRPLAEEHLRRALAADPELKAEARDRFPWLAADQA